MWDVILLSFLTYLFERAPLMIARPCAITLEYFPSVCSRFVSTEVETSGALLCWFLPLYFLCRRTRSCSFGGSNRLCRKNHSDHHQLDSPHWFCVPLHNHNYHRRCLTATPLAYRNQVHVSCLLLWCQDSSMATDFDQAWCLQVFFVVSCFYCRGYLIFCSWSLRLCPCASSEFPLVPPGFDVAAFELSDHDGLAKTGLCSGDLGPLLATPGGFALALFFGFGRRRLI